MSCLNCRSLLAGFIRGLSLAALAAAFVSAIAGDASAQGKDYVASHYTKYEYRIPMRDGKRLFTAVYVPKDQSKTYPFMINRTPYSVRPYGVDQYKPDLGPNPEYGRKGYIFVY
jgi:predicted acyl esterase